MAGHGRGDSKAVNDIFFVKEYRMLLSVCIPAYNRARFLNQLLDSLVTQDLSDVEILICEDKSPERLLIREIVSSYSEEHGLSISYYENNENLGFDRNLRNIIRLSKSEYCLILGNDDLLKPNALASVKEIVTNNKDIGVVLRSYEWFTRDPQFPIQRVQYHSTDKTFERGPRTAAFFYRRVASISGITFRREDCLKYFTEEFDGSLFFQMYLCANILIDKRGAYLSNSLVSCRNTEVPDFGNSSTEKGKHKPGEFNAKSRTAMLTAILNIARRVEQNRGVVFSPLVERDIANYSLFWFIYLKKLGLKNFLHFFLQMGRLGLAKFPLFTVYFVLVLLLGARNSEDLLNLGRGLMRVTPSL